MSSSILHSSEAPHVVERRLGSGVVQPKELSFVAGCGAELVDSEGRVFLDCAAGHGAASLGHAHPILARSIADQAGRLITCTPSYGNDQRAEYLARLSDVLPAGLGRPFLCNSGTEAAEAALKYARLSTGRSGVVACVRGFHGRTMGALSVTAEKRYREPFAPLVPGASHVPYNRVEALEAAVDENTAAVILEVIQGEGGVRPADEAFLAAARAACDAAGALLIVDEVQTGFGRTGRLLAIEHSGLRPDLVCLAKGIGGGVPMGALAMADHLDPWPPGAHGSTFGGNPLACAAGLCVLNVLQGGLLDHARAMGERLMGGLRSIDSKRVREVRGRGLMVGVELRERVAPVLAELQQRRIIALPAGPQVLRLLPPLVIEADQIDHLLTVLQEVLA